MHGEDAHGVIVGIRGDGIVHPHVALGLVPAPRDELLDRGAARFLERARLGEHELDTTPTVAWPPVRERELSHTANVDHSADRLADRLPRPLVMQHSEQTKSCRDRVVRPDGGLAWRQVGPPAVAPLPLRQIVIGAAEARASEVQPRSPLGRSGRLPRSAPPAGRGLQPCSR